VGRRTYLALVLAACAATIAPGCDRDSQGESGRVSAVPARSAPPLASAPASDAALIKQPDDFRGSAGIVEKNKGPTAPRLLKDVRVGRHERYDRVVFEFETAVPGYHLEYVDKPVRQCGSGEATAIAGDAWLEVRFDPADAHTTEGKPTVKERERHLDLPVVREIELTCDFEAQVNWVLGVGSPNRYRALELSDPPRLVVDIHH
jgi:hypothetical protein